VRHALAALAATLTAGLCALGVSGLMAAAGASSAVESAELKDGAGHELTVGRCIVCHSLEYIPMNAPAMNRAAWQKSVDKMRQRFGAPITDEEARQILDYLAANYSGKP